MTLFTRLLCEGKENFRILFPQSKSGRLFFCFFLVFCSLYFLFVIFMYNCLNRNCSIPLLLCFPLCIFGGLLYLRAANFLFSMAGKLQKAEPYIYIYIDRILIVIFCIFSLYYFLSPPSVYADTAVQWEQIKAFQFNDWHPIIHTFLIWGASLFCPSITVITFLQFIILLLSIRYVLHILCDNDVGVVFIKYILLYFLMNPALYWLFSSILKDAAFCIALIIMTGQLLQIFFSNGKYLQRNKNLILFSITLFFVFTIRHNGSLIVLPVLTLLFFIGKQYFLRVLFLLILVCCFILTAKNVFYPILSYPGKLENISIVEIFRHYQGIRKKRVNEVFQETTGIPMSIIISAALDSNTVHPEKLQKFIFKILPEIEWRKYYRIGDYNAIKWHSEHGKTLSVKLAQISKGEFFHQFWTALNSNFSVSLQSFAKMTKIVWAPVAEFDYELPGFPGKTFFRFDKRFLTNMLNNPLFSWLWSTGFCIQLLLLITIAFFHIHYVKLLLLTLPFLCYNLITMFLLCTQDYRFFTFNCLCLPFILAAVLKGTDFHNVSESKNDIQEQ